ncbi:MULTISPECIES: hypothetical protein [unclassified Kribbella]|uniref:hypothetical protein n=1 Tax=unclassified Kribbella TaxID=2644121 RepID=UPI0030770803
MVGREQRPRGARSAATDASAACLAAVARPARSVPNAVDVPPVQAFAANAFFAASSAAAAEAAGVPAVANARPTAALYGLDTSSVKLVPRCRVQEARPILTRTPTTVGQFALTSRCNFVQLRGHRRRR